MSLSSAKAKLDAQGGDPVTGYISKTDHKESYDELLDDTALTGATTAEALDVTGALTAGTVASDGTVAGTGLAGGLLSAATPVINGSAAAGTSAIPSRQDHVHPSDTTKVTKAASSTDNALARFDGTGGDTVQNSGITVDDSGYMNAPRVGIGTAPSFPLQILSGDNSLRFANGGSNATPQLTFGTSSGKSVGLLAGVGGTAFIFDNSGTFSITNDAKATIDAGSSSGGTVRLTVSSAGKVTLANVGAAVGLELGASGPRVMSGTGSPEGVVSAPVGSMWTDTAATTGAIKWIKASGTGNTGWVVEYGDTGWRNVSASLNGTFLTANPNATLKVRRTNNAVQVTYTAGASPTYTTNYGLIYAIPSGFRPNANGEPTVLMLTSAAAPGAAFKSAYFDANNLRSGDGWVTATAYWGSATFTTTDAWPTSLPGSAA
jgi:hypothetical protein